MRTKNTYHLIVIPDDYDLCDDHDSDENQQQSKYFGLILSISILRHLTS